MGTREWIAIDAGQTGLRLRAANRTIEVRSPGVGASAVPSLIRGVAAAWAEFRSHSSHPGGFAGAAIGLTGDFDAADRTEFESALFALLDVGEIRLAHDSIPAYLGALGARPGVVTMCGTGAVTLAWTGTGAPRRFDGLGPLLGDRGGGASLARAGLRAGARALDGTGAGTSLAAPIVEHWGDAMRLASAIREQQPEALGFVRDFARSVAEAVRAGDESATSIVLAGARDAAETTLAAVSITGATTVSYAGAVFREIELFRQCWTDAMREGGPSCTIVAPAGDALDGALVIAAAEPADVAVWGVGIERKERS